MRKTTIALQRELRRKLRQVGVWRTVLHCTAKLLRESRRLVTRSTSLDDPFDRRYGTDTGGILGVGYLDLPEEQMQHAVQYGPISEEEFNRLFAELPIGDEELTFVDLGSGKGRALLLASRFPFKRIIGVELSPVLHSVAVRNVQVFKDPTQRCRVIELVEGDASTFDMPLEPVLCFLFHPFDETVMQAVISRIERSLESVPRPFYVWYIKPESRRPLDEAGCLSLVKETKRYVVYKSRVIEPAVASRELKGSGAGDETACT